MQRQGGLHLGVGAAAQRQRRAGERERASDDDRLGTGWAPPLQGGQNGVARAGQGMNWGQLEKGSRRAWRPMRAGPGGGARKARPLLPAPPNGEKRGGRQRRTRLDDTRLSIHNGAGPGGAARAECGVASWEASASHTALRPRSRGQHSRLPSHAAESGVATAIPHLPNAVLLLHKASARRLQRLPVRLLDGQRGCRTALHGTAGGW